MDNDQVLSPQEELKRILGLGGNTAPQAVGAPLPLQPAPASGGIVPAAPKAAAAMATPATAPPILPTSQRSTDEAELNRLKNSSSGIDQFRQKHPILGTIAKIGEIAGSSLFPSIAAQVPGTEMHHTQLVNREQSRVANDLAGEQEQAKTAGVQAGTEHTQAETGAIPAHTALEEAQTEAIKNKPDKDTSLQQSYADAVNDAVRRGVNPSDDPKVSQYADAITQLQKQPQAMQEKLDQQYQDAIKAGDHETAQRVLKVKHDLAAAGHIENAPKITMIVPGQNGEQTVQTLRPGQQVPAGSRTPTQFGPTAQERNVSAQAQVAAEGIPTVINEVDKLKDQLGPVSGRWNEFMQGRVGMENPELAGFRADLLMVSSAVALAHARGRLPENLREEFDNAINSPKQNPENLKAVLNHILPWMQRMTNMTDQPHATAQSGAQDTNAPPAGAKVRDYTQLAQ